MAHLVFQTAFPGDLFLSIPLIRRIKEWDPGTRLVLACRPGLGEYFLKSGLVDEVIEINKRKKEDLSAAQAKLEAREWDTIFVPHISFRTAMMVRPLKAKGGKIGFKLWWNGLFFTKRVVKCMNLPDALRQLSLLTPLDSTLAENFAQPELDQLTNPQDQKPLEDFKNAEIPDWASMQVATPKTKENTIYLAPGSVWNTKRWTLSGYSELARKLVKRGFSVALVGSKSERELCTEIQEQVPEARNLAGETSLSELVEMFRSGKALICNDSGSMHAASAAGLPTVAVFGPTVLSLGFRPWQQQSLVVQRELKCRPCGKHGAQVCPIGTHECMTGISSDHVLAALEKLL